MANEAQAARQRRYYVRKRAAAQALLAGGVKIDLAWFGINQDGEHVAIDSEGNRIELVVRSAASPTIEHKETARKKLYPPKAMPPETYEKNVSVIREKSLSKDAVRKELLKAAEDTDDPQKSKGARQFLALLDALPDGPDWSTHFPS